MFHENILASYNKCKRRLVCGEKNILFIHYLNQYIILYFS